jgi:DNA-binding transcriptional MerR regulator
MIFVGRTFTIGELARRTGLPVKTIRFYSDEGLLPPTDRTQSGYRLYDVRAMARLELIKTLRELGLGLGDVSRILAREATVPQLAARHVEALDEQIRRLRLRRAVLRAVIKRESEPEEVKLMNKLASMSDEERARLLDEFWTEMTDGSPWTRSSTRGCGRRNRNCPMIPRRNRSKRGSSSPSSSPIPASGG